MTKPVNEFSIEVASIYGVQTRQGLVELTWNGEKAQMTLDKAREIVGMLQGAIEAAITDQLLIQFLMEKIGLPLEAAGRALLDFREMRQGTRATARPS